MECKQNQCQHTNPIPFNNKFFCKFCGIHMPQDGNVAIKSTKFLFPGYINPIQNLKSQWNRSVPVAQLPSDYQRQRLSLIDYMMEWSEKLGLSINSLFLAVQFLDYFVSQKKVDPIQYRLYGATCLMLAAKSIELDERIPFISKLRRYTYLPYATIDFRKCECQIIKQFNWNLQYTTLIDWAETVMSLGIVYEQDELSQTETILKEKATNIIQLQQNNQQTKQDNIKEQLETTPKKSTFISKNIYNKVQEKFTKLCLTLLKDGSYLDKDPSELTLSLIGCVRKICGLKHPLPNCLLELYENIQPKFQDSIADLLSKQTKQPTSVIGKAFINDLDFFSLQNYKNRIL
ncbi:unnamed protein product [Paramecium pentaurelia]|uniref:Cyclin-like domain-containing protein n=1 Tax=Paramecium pentaurelia TaxID=43138 RepID=A0A8S1SKU8_9CILI|nr:unnamed protein product [Paramecium pentaurelia]